MHKSMKRPCSKLYALVMAALMVGMPSASSAEVYKYRDSAGRIHLTDQPMRGNYRLLKTYRFETGARPAITTYDALGAMQERRRAVAPAIDQVAAETNLPPELLHAVVRAESAYDPRAVSRKGAVGLMQLMPATAQRYGVDDRENPAQNLRGGAHYLRDLLEMFDQNLHLALAAYNAGENAVLRYGRQIPPYQETQTYVKRVLAFLGENRQLARQERLVQN